MLMDFESMDSWIGTKAAIVSELDSIDGEIGKCVLLLQGFDLARQVIEHRLREADYLVQHLPALVNQSLPWQEAKDALLQLAR
ncbi:hypothetical protein ACPXBB_25825, partial [Escherichia coli]|uniref:hypothetical protein n=1 Tax=Escherichia coli TaxID=562 RepID=UPI003CF98E3C